MSITRAEDLIHSWDRCINPYSSLMLTFLEDSNSKSAWLMMMTDTWQTLRQLVDPRHSALLYLIEIRKSWNKFTCRNPENRYTQRVLRLHLEYRSSVTCPHLQRCAVCIVTTLSLLHTVEVTLAVRDVGWPPKVLASHGPDAEEGTVEVRKRRKDF